MYKACTSTLGLLIVLKAMVCAVFQMYAVYVTLDADTVVLKATRITEWRALLASTQRQLIAEFVRNMNVFSKVVLHI